jgi:ABC-type multidrug transport system fused ATPase/permease subunit
VSDATKPEPGKAEPAKSSDSGAAQPSLLSELNELQSPTTVQELEVVHASASALISDAVAEAAAKRETIPPPIAPPFIDFDNVSIGFGDRKILDNVSFHVGRGQTLCILGRSGVGKSVSLRILLGFLKADSGCVRVDGQDIASASTSAASRRCASTSPWSSRTARSSTRFPSAKTSPSPCAKKAACRRTRFNSSSAGCSTW